MGAIYYPRRSWFKLIAVPANGSEPLDANAYVGRVRHYKYRDSHLTKGVHLVDKPETFVGVTSYIRFHGIG